MYVNELNVMDKQLIVTDATLGSRVDRSNETQIDMKGVDDGIKVRLDALETTKVALQEVDVNVASRIDALNATDAALKARLDALMPPKCIPLGGDKL